MTQQKTSRGALARRAPLGIASIFPTDSYFEHIQYHGEIKIFRWRFEVSEPTASFFYQIVGLRFARPRFATDAIESASWCKCRWHYLSESDPLPTSSDRPLCSRYRRSAAADQRRIPRQRCTAGARRIKLLEKGGFRPGMTQIPVTGGGHE
jgi:hypothetical protein